MKTFQHFYYITLTQPRALAILKFLVLLSCCFIAGHAFAGDDNTDILAGTEGSLKTTLNGTGKKFLYMAEGILSLAMYIKTKNLLVLGGLVVVAVFINIILKVVN